MKQKEKSVIGWLADFAGTHKSLYTASVLLAVCGVACSIVPYAIMGDIVAKLIAGNRQWEGYLREGMLMALFWLGRVVFHAMSTTCSHKATFHVLETSARGSAISWRRYPWG